MLSRILARLAVKGSTIASAGSASADKLPILASDGKLDPTTYTAGGGGGGASAATTTFNPVYTNSTLDHGSTGEGGASPQDVQAALQEIDLQKLQYDKNLLDVGNPVTSFNNIKVAASTTVCGSVELATLAEGNAGTANGGDTLVTGGTPKLVLGADTAKSLYVNKYDVAGDTMAGPLTLPNASPTLDSHAARKKYVDDEITARITANSQVPTGKILWVDSVNGKLLADATPPVRGRLDRPFSKLAEAKTTAQTGDTIFVFPGTYDERNLLKDGVNWYFMPGAKITTTANVNGGIWTDDGSYGTNAAVTCKIMGYGEFTNGATLGTAHVFHVTNSSSNIYVECMHSTATSSSGGSAIVQSNGILTMIARQSLINNSGSIIDVSGGTLNLTVDTLTGSNGLFFTGAPTVNIRFRTFTTSLYAVLYTSSPTGTFSFIGDTVTCSGAGLSSLFALTGGASGSTYLEVRTATGGTSNDQVVLAPNGAHKIKIVDSELIGTKNTSAAAVIKAYTASNVTLKDVDMTCHSSNTNCIIPNTSETPTVTLHGYVRSNKPKHASVTFSHGMFEQV